MFQSSRVARPQDAFGAPNLVSLLTSSTRSYLDAYQHRLLRPVSEVANMEAQLGPAGRYVDPVFQHSRRHNVGFIRDLVNAGSAGFAETETENGWGSEKFINCARASNRHFLNPLAGPLLTLEEV